MSEAIDETGNVYCRLRVIKRVPRPPNYKSISRLGAFWLCKCKCGNYVTVYGNALRMGVQKSCGCLTIKQSSKYIHKKTNFPQRNYSSHASNRVYRKWCGLIQKCNNRKDPSYKYYGGQRIKLCEEWSESFLEFERWYLSQNRFDGCAVGIKEGANEFSPKNCFLLEKNKWRAMLLYGLKIREKTIAGDSKDASE